MKLIAILAATLAISGCGAEIAAMHGIAIIQPTDFTKVYEATKVSSDAHTGSTTVEGPTIFHDNHLLKNTYAVRSWINKNNSLLNDRFQVYVVGNFNEWAFLNQAYSNGQMLDTTLISRKVGHCSSSGCSVSETVGVNLSRERVKELAGTGLSFKIAGQRGDVTMLIPATYFGAIQKRHEEARGTPNEAVVPTTGKIQGDFPTAPRS
ncbi:hypothetical protein [Limoniibacter endophyticus]